MSVRTHAPLPERRARLEGLVSAPGTGPSVCLSTSQLLDLMGNAYGEKDRRARQRLLQLDLDALCETGRIEKANPGGKPLRYRRRITPPRHGKDPWKEALGDIRDLVARAAEAPQLTRLWERLLYGLKGEGPLLAANRLRVIPDTLRLQPASLYPEVLLAVLNALVYGYALQVSYRNARGERSQPCLHPQALVLRGPIPYLLALKNDEEEPLRFYALNRMLNAEPVTDLKARQPEDFDLDEALQDGRLDFGQGEWIDLELLVRGYLTSVVRDCPLAPDQTWKDEADDSAFDIRVEATLPSTGQLLRWLLAAGDNIKVIAPPDLRKTLADQTRKAAALYAPPSGPPWTSCPSGRSRQEA